MWFIGLIALDILFLIFLCIKPNGATISLFVISIISTIAVIVYRIVKRTKDKDLEKYAVKEPVKFVVNGQEYDSISLRKLCDPDKYFDAIFSLAKETSFDEETLPDFLAYALMRSRLQFVEETLKRIAEEYQEQIINAFDYCSLGILMSRYISMDAEDAGTLFETRTTAYEYLFMNAENRTLAYMHLANAFRWFLRNCGNIEPYGVEDAKPYRALEEMGGHAVLGVEPPFSNEETRQLMLFDSNITDAIQETEGLVNWFYNQAKEK